MNQMQQAHDDMKRSSCMSGDMSAIVASRAFAAAMMHAAESDEAKARLTISMLERMSLCVRTVKSSADCIRRGEDGIAIVGVDFEEYANLIGYFQLPNHSPLLLEVEAAIGRNLAGRLRKSAARLHRIKALGRRIKCSIDEAGYEAHSRAQDRFIDGRPRHLSLAEQQELVAACREAVSAATAGRRAKLAARLAMFQPAKPFPGHYLAGWAEFFAAELLPAPIAA